MKLVEVAGSADALQSEIAKLKATIATQGDHIDQQDANINDLLIDMGTLNRTLAALIKKLGPRAE